MMPVRRISLAFTSKEFEKFKELKDEKTWEKFFMECVEAWVEVHEKKNPGSKQEEENPFL